MRIQTITRTAETCSRERKGDLPAMPRSLGEAAHPFSRAREYVRAVNAAKLDRLFAKPLVCALPDAHRDGVYCLAASPASLPVFASGSADGEVRVWDVGARTPVFCAASGHRFVRGVALTGGAGQSDPETLLSAGDDGVVRLWRFRERPAEAHASYASGQGALTGVDAHRDGRLFAASGTEEVAVWDVARTDAPLLRLRWGSDTVSSVRFSRAEPSLFSTCGADRAVVLHDLRVRTPVARAVVRMRCNASAFSPQDGPLFAAACDDANAYVFDMRRLARPLLALAGHAAAVTDVDWCPTGTGLVTAGYDRTLRLWDSGCPRARDVYHTKRMQRATAARFSLDATYVLSASDDGALRLWKARASAPLGPQTPRQTDAMNYAAALVSKHAAVPGVRRIAGRRRLPAAVRASAAKDAQRRESDERKALRRARAKKTFVAPGKPDPRDGVVLDASVAE